MRNAAGEQATLSGEPRAAAGANGEANTVCTHSIPLQGSQGKVLTPLEAWTINRAVSNLPVSDHTEAIGEPAMAVLQTIERADPGQRYPALQAALTLNGFNVGTSNTAIMSLPKDAPPPPATKPRYTIHPANDALVQLPPIDWIVEGLLSKGSVDAVVGEGGSKKTYSLLDMAVCVALGQKFLQFPTVQGTVLVIDEESGHNRLRRRLSQVIRGHGAFKDVPLYYTTLEHFNLSDPVDVAHVGHIIEELKPAMVVIDALADVMPGCDENSVGEVHPIFISLRKIAEDHQCAIVVIHHANKAGGYRGSTAIKAAVDLMLMVSSRPETTKIDITTEKARDIEPVTFSAIFRFDVETDTVRLEPAAATPTSIHYSRAEEYVIRWLTKHPRALFTDITANADACTPRAAENAVYSLARKGVVQRCDGGRQGSPAAYTLCTTGGTDDE